LRGAPSTRWGVHTRSGETGGVGSFAQRAWNPGARENGPGPRHLPAQDIPFDELCDLDGAHRRRGAGMRCHWPRELAKLFPALWDTKKVAERWLCKEPPGGY
jgi:hypothetical protein